MCHQQLPERILAGTASRAAMDAGPDILGMSVLRADKSSNMKYLLARLDYLGNFFIDSVALFEVSALPSTYNAAKRIEAESKRDLYPPEEVVEKMTLGKGQVLFLCSLLIFCSWAISLKFEVRVLLNQNSEVLHWNSFR